MTPVTPVIVEQIVSGFSEILRNIRSTCYEVSLTSFKTVFRQLLADKHIIDRLKGTFYSKNYRRFRRYSLYAGIGVWIRELEDLVSVQITSYRLNVEAEVLDGCSNNNSNSNSSTNGVGGSKVPSQLVLERLQNNVSVS